MSIITSDFLEGNEYCGRHIKIADTATLESHDRSLDNGFYGDFVECVMTFTAMDTRKRLVMEVFDLDLPTSAITGCQDVLFVHDGVDLNYPNIVGFHLP